MKEDKKYMPWWGYICIAAIIYGGLTYGAQYFLTGSEHELLVGLAARIAPILSIVFLLLGANALYRDDGVDEELAEDSQESQKSHDE